MNTTTLTSGMAARRLGISKRTLLRAVQRGEIVPSTRTPGGWIRFLSTDVEVYARHLAGHSAGLPHSLAGPPDFAERAAAAETIRKSEERYRALSEHLAEVVAIVDEAGIVRYASLAYRGVLGREPSEIVGTTGLADVHPEDADGVRARWAARAAGERDFSPTTVRVRHADGTWRWMESIVVDARNNPAIGGFVVTSRDITEQQRARQEAAILGEVSLALSEVLDMARLYELILEQAARLLPYDLANVIIHQDGWAVIAASAGAPALAAGARFARLDGSEPFWQPALGAPAYLPDTALEPGWRDIPPHVGERRIRSHISVPLVFDRAQVGSFTVGSIASYAYTEHHIRLAGAFGDRVNQALRNARLYLAEQERVRVAEELAWVHQEEMREAEALAEVSAAMAGTLEPSELYTVILAQATKVLPCEHAMVILYQDGWGVVAACRGTPYLPTGTRAFPLRDTDPFWIPDKADRPVYLPDTTREPTWRDIPPWVGEYRIRSLISVPLRIDGVLLGSFDVCSTRSHFYTERQVHLAGSFADRATQALRNARLFVAEQERTRVAEELARLRQEQAGHAETMAQVSAALASTLEPEQVYALILEQFSRILPFDHACVLLHQDGWAAIAGSRGRVTLPAGTRVFRVADLDTIAAFGVAGRPALIRDTAALANWIAVPPFTGDQRIRSVIVVPLMADGVVVGSFTVDSFTPDFYTERHLALAVTFGDLVIQALRNARLYTAEQERTRAAKALAQLRGDFLASVSHELRTPLTAIVGFGELLRERWDQFSEAQRLQRITYIVQAANRQQRLVEDLLLIGRIETASLAPKSATLTLAPLIQQASVEVQGSYAGQSFLLDGPSDLRVHADAAHVTQVLVNLLDNAAKYSPEASPITVCWGLADGMAVVRVIDLGSGVPPQGRDQLFTRFGRMPGSKIRAGRVGTGLGLYISRGLAEAMGGSLELEATGLEGSTFQLRLPLASPGESPLI